VVNGMIFVLNVHVFLEIKSVSNCFAFIESVNNLIKDKPKPGQGVHNYEKHEIGN
jgi:hypothetical protein